MSLKGTCSRLGGIAELSEAQQCMVTSCAHASPGCMRNIAESCTAKPLVCCVCGTDNNGVHGSGNGCSNSLATTVSLIQT